MKTTVEITDSLFHEAKRYAASRGLSFREVIEAGLRRVLETGREARGPFRLRKHTFKGKGLAAEGGWREVRRRIYEGRGE